MVKQKRCGKIKGRAYADGRKQRSYVPRKDATSPTLQLESLSLSLLIDAHENRHVGTADVAGAFLLANMTDFVLVKFKGESVSIMCKMNPSYKQYVTIENGKEVLYLQLLKALYGCIQSALLWYKTFTGKLSELGFTLNKYDPCVANKWINGSQCTICWYVDDTKMSHKDPKVIDWLVNELEQEFRKLTVKRGNKHTFVGIDFEIMSNGTVRLLMKDYLKEYIESYEEIEGPITGSANTPAKHDLFNTNNRVPMLNEKRKNAFHHIVSKLLYVSNRARIDIDLAISYLCTRVSKSTIEDWDKLKRLLTYIKNTIDMPRYIGADGINVHDLFNTNNRVPMLNEKRKNAFHHIVSKLLYLCTRVSKSNIEDWDKLKRLLTYIKNTIDMPRYIRADGINVLKTYVDASYAVHPDMRGHTGGVISLGKGVFRTKCAKQKLNTKSSTETEVVGASDYLPWTLWATRFLKEQSYTLADNIFYQDNQSAMRIEQNGRLSCGEKSSYIHIRYFFIVDVIKRENIKINHCRTEKMVADYYTKLLQGTLFRKMRDALMGLTSFPIEERIEIKKHPILQ